MPPASIDVAAKANIDVASISDSRLLPAMRPRAAEPMALALFIPGMILFLNFNLASYCVFPAGP